MYGDSDYILTPSLLTILIFFQVIMIPITIQSMRTMPIYILCILNAIGVFAMLTVVFTIYAVVEIKTKN